MFKKITILFLLLLITVGLFWPLAPSQAAINLMSGVSPKCHGPSSTGDCTVCDMLVVLFNVAKMVFMFMSAIALIMLLVAGVGLILNMGNMESVASNKRIIVNTVIAVGIIMVAWTLVNFTIYALLGKQPGQKLDKQFWSTEYWYKGPSCK